VKRLLARPSIRTRLTLWYASALAGVLILYAGTVFLFLRHALYSDLDRELREDVERVQEALEPTDDGRLAWRVAGHSDHADDSSRYGRRWMEVWSLDGRLLLRPATAPPLDLPAPRAPGPDAEPMSLVQGGARLRVLADVEDVAGVRVLVRVARSEEPLRRELGDVLLMQAIGLPLALGLASLGGYHLARRALAPVGRMAESARRISAERLAERLAVENPSDELGHLAAVFNDAFARLERSFEQMRRFTADASHELRTPLTALRSVGEVGLQERPDDKLFGDVVGSMLEEADRLTHLVDTLLTLSRADVGQVRLACDPVDLAALAGDVAHYLTDLADEKQQTLHFDAPAPVIVSGDRLVLRQALVNIVDNAIKYSANGTSIDVRAGGDGQHGWIEVADQGPGIGEADRQRVFERFYRVDKARSREEGGTGLGLSLAQWAIEANGGRIDLESALGRGSVFRLLVPRGVAPVDAGAGEGGKR
jgi:heavy metal sensor kinase